MRVFRFALRSLRRNPGFSAAAVVSLALGIGANTAMFSLLDALMFRPLPVADPDRLVKIGGELPSTLTDAIRKQRIYESVCGFATPLLTIELAGRVAPRHTHAMDGVCFETLGVRAVLGRGLGPSDDVPGAARVAVVTYDAWQREFGGQNSVLEQSVRIGNDWYQIVGVTEPRFKGLWVGFPPSVLYASVQTRMADASWGNIFARVAPGETMAQTTARLQIVWPQLLAETVPSMGMQRDKYLSQPLVVIPATVGLDYQLRGRFEGPLTALVGVAALALIVSCVNLANLWLARAFHKRREASMRLALGAGRRELLLEPLAESLLLMIGGVSLGLWLAYWGAGALVSLFAVNHTGFVLDVRPDRRILAFTAAAAAVAFLVLAVGPAWKNSRVTTLMLTADASRSVGDRGRLRQLFVVVQVALTLMLVVTSSLFVSTLTELRRVPLGYEPEGLLTATLAQLPGGSTTAALRADYYQELLTRLRQAPGVRSAALTYFAPLGSPPVSDYASPAARDRSPIKVDRAVVSDGFFAATGIGMVQGVEFAPRHVPDNETAIVSESLARQLFGSDTPALGRSIRLGIAAGGNPLRIVGVAHDAIIGIPKVRNTAIVYVNLWDVAGQRSPTLVVRTAGSVAPVADFVRSELRRGGREFAMSMRTVIEARDAALAQERLLASLSVGFGALSLVLAAVGLFGLLNFSVTVRTSEIGVRTALGASRAAIVWLMLREALALIAIGIAVGLPLAWVSRNLVSTLLVGIGRFAGGTLVLSIALLTVVGTAAAFIPARRAAFMTPMTALRRE
jgi:predicted permease